MSELLDRIKKWCDSALDNNCSMIMHKYELVDMLNYITNLEQENKQLKEDKKKAIMCCSVCSVMSDKLLEILGDKE